MPININPLNPEGFNNLAAKQLGSLNLPVANNQFLANAAKAYTEGTQQKVQNALAQQQVGSPVAVANIQNQGNIQKAKYDAQSNLFKQMQEQQFQAGQQTQKLGSEENRTGMEVQGKLLEANQTAALKQQELAQQQQKNVGELAIQQKTLDQAASKTQFEQKMLLDDKDLKKQGAAAASLIMMTNGITDPAELATKLNAGIETLHGQGLINDVDYKGLKNSTPEQQQQILAQHLMISGQADKLKDVPGINTVFGQGTLSNETKTDLQNHLVKQQQTINNMKSLVDSFPAQIFTNEGRIAATAGALLDKSPQAAQDMINKMLPAGYTVQQAKDAAATEAGYFAKVSTTITGAIQDLKGVRLSETALEHFKESLPKPSDSPEQAKAKLQAGIEFVTNAMQVDTQVLRGGLNPADAQKHLEALVDSTHAKLNTPTQAQTDQQKQTSPTAAASVHITPAGKKYDLAKIRAANPGVSDADIISQLNGQK